MTDASEVCVAAVGVHVLDIHVVGIDSLPGGSDGQLVQTIRMSPAGTAGGTAVVLSRLGARVRSYGTTGDDPLADSLIAALDREGIDTEGLVRTGATQTSASVIPLRPNGDRPAWHCVGSNAAFGNAAVDLDGCTHLHVGGPEFIGGPAAAELLGRARSAGISTSIDILAGGDPGLLQWISDALPHTDYLLPNDEQVLGFTGAKDLVSGAHTLIEMGVRCVAVTRGGDGALVVTADEVFEIPAYAIDVIDTTGCGDAFSAGFILGRALGRSLQDSARLGCATAAQVAQGLGTDAGAYSLATVDEFAGTATVST
ncbi:carbohydrate kinase family protein [Mycobacterium sp. NPDC003323]